ncbi:MAG: haloacid dehalogenase type II [Chloroflexota bacterium]|nr:haloacid dehalogenase type II [Chloroflexota bacterium]
MMHPRDAAVISFDCYGTLIDWQSGARAAVDAIPELADVDKAALVARRLAVELEVEHERYRPYDDVLAISVRRTASEFGVELDDAAARSFADSIASWPSFQDAGGFLKRLATVGTPMTILSNVTRASLAVSVRKLGASFDQLVTAEDVRSYKPDHDHWRELYRSRQIEPDQQLHIAGSITHDIRPAAELGATTVWVRRAHEPLPKDVHPDLIVQSLAELGDYWRLHYSR